MGYILVTGGAGFIGSYLTERLIDEGYKVIIVDNLSKGRIGNIKNVLDDVVLIKGDILNIKLMADLVRKADLVFHLAAISRVITSIKNPVLCFKVNIIGTEILARLCSKFGRKLIFSSSREVYGNAQYLPVDEFHPLNPLNPYGVSKVASEKVVEAYSKCHSLRYIIFRLANVYGPRDTDRVIPIFIEQALKGEPLYVYGKDKVLDFLYIEDAIDAFLKTLELDIDNVTLNLGSGIGTRLDEIANLIVKFTKSESKIVIKKERKWEVRKFIADIRRSKKLLNWNPKISLRNGLERIIEFHSCQMPNV